MERSSGNLIGLEAVARERLPAAVFDYFAGGAEDEVTLAANLAAYRRWALRPRVLQDVSRVDASTELLGEPVSWPVLIAPTAFQRLATEEGERATARAAGRAGCIYVVSTLSNFAIEDIAAAATGPLWLQLYVFRDRGLTRELVQRAKAAGCRALCLTVTVPVQGNRERDLHNRFHLPESLEMANFRGLRQATMPQSDASGLMAFISREFDPSLTWETVEWLRTESGLPVLIKGIMTGADARLAIEHGAAGIIVSNHGGRQLDGTQATLDALPEVAATTDGRIPVLLDGGIRRGTDIVKALCLGAGAVLVGRPVLWALAVGGEDAVVRALGVLRAELER